MIIKAKWFNGKSIIKGSYEWIWHANGFRINLDKPASYCGERRRSFFLLGEDTPEWNNWKLLRSVDNLV